MTCFSGWSSSLYLFAADHFIQLAPHAHRAFIRTKQDRVQVPKIMIANPALLQLYHRLVLCSEHLRACFRIHLVERDIFKREVARGRVEIRSEEHTSELQSLMRISYAVFCLKKKQQ